jgi:hypothetical protein
MPARIRSGLLPRLLRVRGTSRLCRGLDSFSELKLTPRCSKAYRHGIRFSRQPARSSHWLDFRYTDPIRAGGMPTAPPLLTAGFRRLLQAVQSDVTSVESPG